MRFCAALVVFLQASLGCATTPPPEPPPRAVLAAYLKEVTVAMEAKHGGLCAGVWVAKRVFVTAAHCVDGEQVGELGGIRYRLPNDKTNRPAAVLHVSETHDIATVVTEDTPEHPIALPGGLPAPGDRVMAMGHPVGLFWSLSAGDVAAVRDVEGVQMIQTTTPVSPGNSGGGLFNERGELLGVASFIVLGRGVQNLNFFVPIQFAP